MGDRKLILVELNEINFDVVKLYLNKGESLPAFSKIIKDGIIETSAEKEYNHLEPWIQWPSIHIGKNYNEHQIFRLGDMANSSQKQIFELVEEAGYKVGAISPMNTKNNLKNPSYFIPDPWTATPSDNSYLNKKITQAISQAVNDNASSKITLKSMAVLIFSFFIFVKPSKYIPLIFFALSSIIKPWRKALFLDLFLFEIHHNFFRKNKPNFSTLFLNAGAHIQHHYFLNSSVIKDPKIKNPQWYIKENADPILDMLKSYDSMISNFLSYSNVELIIATGLSQKPFDIVKFYYRLSNHENFLKLLNIKFKKIQPRMTRDFLIEFSDEEQAMTSEKILSAIKVNNSINLFDSIDNRGKDLFVTMTYPKEITKSSYIFIKGDRINLYDYVTFVAIKNGMHQEKGFAYFSSGIKDYAPNNKDHVSELFMTVSRYFNLA